MKLTINDRGDSTLWIRYPHLAFRIWFGSLIPVFATVNPQSVLKVSRKKREKQSPLAVGSRCKLEIRCSSQKFEVGRMGKGILGQADAFPACSLSCQFSCCRTLSCQDDAQCHTGHPGGRRGCLLLCKSLRTVQNGAVREAAGSKRPLERNDEEVVKETQSLRRKTTPPPSFNARVSLNGVPQENFLHPRRYVSMWAKAPVALPF